MTASITSMPVGFATVSAGLHPSHTLVRKLELIAAAGFAVVEIRMEDLEGHTEVSCRYVRTDEVGGGDATKLEQAAQDIGQRCLKIGLGVLTLMA